VNAQVEDYPAGWLTQFRRGVFAGLATLVVAVGTASAVTLLAWLIPGPDSASAIAAIKAAGLIVLSGHHGGIRLDGTLVTLAPLGVSLLLGWLAVSGARRAESSSAFGGWCVGYTAGCVLLASWSRLGGSYAPTVPSALAGMCFATVVGGAGRYYEVLWDRLSARWQRVIRASAAAVAVYVLVAALLAAAVMARHLDQIVALQHRISPGASGLPVALLGIAATPNATVATVGYLAGPGFEIGSHTSVSIFGVTQGRLPIFPLLAAVPTGRPLTALGIALGVLTALLAGALCNRSIRTGARLRPMTADAAAVSLLAAGVLAVVSELAAGGVGNGALRSVGATWWTVGGCAMVAVFVGTAACAAADRVRQRLDGHAASAQPLRTARDSGHASSDTNVRSFPTRKAG
jgi:hypothetical protein